jgi:acyl-CoA thioester hydrolase
VGYDVARYRAMDRYWLVRETDIEYMLPLRYGDEVTIKTWVLDFRRVRSRRAYELRRAADSVLAARAQTDWVYLDLAHERPVSVPPALMSAFLPDGPPEDVPPRAPFPAAPPPPPGVFSHRRRVQWSDVDPAAHVNNAVYLSYLEHCAIQDAVSRGWTAQRMRTEGNFAIVARRYHIEYRQQAFLNEELEISTWISDVRRATAVRHYAVHRVRDGALLARARALWVWVDPETGRPRRVPPSFIDDFAANIADEEA